MSLADQLLQRATCFRVAGRSDEAAADLVDAELVVGDAIEEWSELTPLDSPHALSSQLAARGIRLGCHIEEVALSATERDLLGEARDLVRGTFDSAGEPPLRVATRVARLGSAHLRTAGRQSGRLRQESLARAHAYLQLGWERLQHEFARPWLVLDLYEATRAVDGPDAAQRFAAQALDRLEPQCGPDYPVCLELRSAIG